ncbi:MAG: tetratricopeptide repeat protein [Dokdonella sp.]
MRSEFDTDPNSKAMLDLQSVIGEIEVRRGRLDLAKTLTRKLRDSSLANLPANTASLPDRYGQLANVELRLGEYQKAKTHFEEAVRLETERAGQKSRAMIYGRLGLAEVLLHLGDKSAAREQLALVKLAVDTLAPGHSQRKRYAELEKSAGE